MSERYPNRSKLDKAPDYYWKNGNHCNKPGSCVMFDTAKGTPTLVFCDDCAKTVKKVDLTKGTDGV